MSGESIQSNSGRLEMTDTIKRLWELVSVSLDKLEKLRLQNQELLNRNNKLEQSLGDKDSNFYDIVNQKSEFELKIHELNKKNQELESKLNDFENLSGEIDFLNLELKKSEEKFKELESVYILSQEKSKFVSVLDDELSKEKEVNAALILEKTKLEQEVARLTPVEKNISIVSKELAHKNLVLNERADEIEILKIRIAELDNTIFKYKNIERNLDKEIQSKNEVLRNFETYKNDNELAINDLKSELSKRDELINTLQNEIDDIYLPKIKVLESHIKENDNLITELNSQIDVFISKNIELNRKISDFEKSLKSRLENHEGMIDKESEPRTYIDYIVGNEQELVSGLDNSLIIKDIEIKALTSRLNELEKLIEEKNESIKLLNSGLKDDIADDFIELKKINNELMLRCEELSKENTKLNETVLEVTEKNSHYTDLLNRIKEAFLAIFPDDESLEIENLPERIKYIENDVSELRRLNSDLKSDLALLMNEKESLVQSLQHSKDDLSSKDKVLNDYKDEVHSLMDKILRINTILKEKSLLVDEQAIKIDELKSIIKNISEQLIQKDKELTELKSVEGKSLQIILDEEPTEKINELQDKISDSLKIIENLSNDLIEKSESLKISEKINDEYKSKIESLELLVKTRYEQISLLENQLNRMIDEKNDDVLRKIELNGRIDDYLQVIDKYLASTPKS